MRHDRRVYRRGSLRVSTKVWKDISGHPCDPNVHLARPPVANSVRRKIEIIVRNHDPKSPRMHLSNPRRSPRSRKSSRGGSELPFRGRTAAHKKSDARGLERKTETMRLSPHVLAGRQSRDALASPLARSCCWNHATRQALHHRRHGRARKPKALLESETKIWTEAQSVCSPVHPLVAHILSASNESWDPSMHKSMRVDPV